MYDDPSSSQSRRLPVVVQMIRHHLDSAPPGAVRVLSLCAGDGRDLSIAARDHPRASDLTGCLIELDPQLSRQAVVNISTLGTNLDVRRADAGAPAEFTDVVPVDLLLLCGIFGNMTDEDICRVITATPAICSPGATVIWTRHRREPDATPAIRRWFDDVECVSTGFASPGVGNFAVGSERFTGTTGVLDSAARLFSFRDDLW